MAVCVSRASSRVRFASHPTRFQLREVSRVRRPSIVWPYRYAHYAARFAELTAGKNFRYLSDRYSLLAPPSLLGLFDLLSLIAMQPHYNFLIPSPC